MALQTTNDEYLSDRMQFKKDLEMSHSRSRTGEDPIITIMKLEKQLRRLRVQDKHKMEEIRRLNQLIEQMKNIKDDELLVIEKVETKEVYGKPNQPKPPQVRKEIHEIRVERDKLKVIKTTNERIIRDKQARIESLETQIRRLRTSNGKVVYKTEYVEDPKQSRLIESLRKDLRILRKTKNRVQTVGD